MFRIVLMVLFVGVSSIASAQQMPDAAFLQHAVTSLQAQRNNALDAQAIAEAKVAGLTEELTKATAKIKELEDAKNVEPKKK